MFTSQLLTASPQLNHTPMILYTPGASTNDDPFTNHFLDQPNVCRFMFRFNSAPHGATLSLYTYAMNIQYDHRALVHVTDLLTAPAIGSQSEDSLNSTVKSPLSYQICLENSEIVLMEHLHHPLSNTVVIQGTGFLASSHTLADHGAYIPRFHGCLHRIHIHLASMKSQRFLLGRNPCVRLKSARLNLVPTSSGQTAPPVQHPMRLRRPDTQSDTKMGSNSRFRTDWTNLKHLGRNTSKQLKLILACFTSSIQITLSPFVVRSLRSILDSVQKQVADNFETSDPRVSGLEEAPTSSTRDGTEEERLLRGQPSSLTRIEIHSGFRMLWFITDSDVIVPLFTVLVKKLSTQWRRTLPWPIGSLLARGLSVNYYNRDLLAWEPFVEPWSKKLSTQWRRTLPWPIGSLLARGLSVNYYNRDLLAWEPFVEPWSWHEIHQLKFYFDYHLYLINSIKHAFWFLSQYYDVVTSAQIFELSEYHSARLIASETLNFNLTVPLSVLLRKLMSQDSPMQSRSPEYRDSPSSQSPQASQVVSSTTEPVPISSFEADCVTGTSLFRLVNQTGSTVWFQVLPIVESDSIVDDKKSLGTGNNVKPRTVWHQIRPDTGIVNLPSPVFRQNDAADSLTFPWLLEKPPKLLIQVSGWKPTYPISVDRLGVFFRTLERDSTVKMTLEEDHLLLEDHIPSFTRLVIEVIRTGSSLQHSIVLRSGLTVTNDLPDGHQLLVGLQLVPPQAVDTPDSSPGVEDVWSTHLASNQLVQRIPLLLVESGQTASVPLNLAAASSTGLGVLCFRPTLVPRSPGLSVAAVFRQRDGPRYTSYDWAAVCLPDTVLTEDSSMAESSFRRGDLASSVSQPIELSESDTIKYMDWTSLKQPGELIEANLICRTASNQVGLISATLDSGNINRTGDNRPVSTSSHRVVGLPVTSVPHRMHRSRSLPPPQYNMSLVVVRDQFPPDPLWIGLPDRSTDRLHPKCLPGHHVTVGPLIRITNLLPCEFNYFFEGTAVTGTLGASEDACVHEISPLAVLKFGVHLEGFDKCEPLNIPPNTYNQKVLLRLQDTLGRPLELQVQVVSRAGSARHLTVSGVIWLINDSGLPLIFAQSSAVSVSTAAASQKNRLLANVAAGQYEEHEQARSMCPLLFSFANKNEGFLLRVRIGRGLLSSGSNSEHTQSKSFPAWSPAISLDKRGVDMLQLKVINSTNNRQAFHWPRDDLDRFLCVRALLTGNTSLSQNVTSTGQTSSTWSGGFQIDRPYAFTVMLRLPTSSKLVKALSSDINNSDSFSSTLLNRLFLRIVILLRAATFHVRIEDANALPPPFRLENMSYVALSYQQVTSTLLTPENSSVTVTSTPNLRRARRIGHRTQSRSEQQRLSTGELDGDSLADTGVENVEMDKSWPGGAVQSYLSPQTSTPYALEEPQYAPTIILLSSGSNSEHTQSKSFPAWSPAISLDKRGVDMLQLKVINSTNNRPDLVYHVGFEVREGHGRHAVTTVVTFRPRYVIDNWCGLRLQVAQRGCAQTRLGDSARHFIGPRDDLDRFLCVRALLTGNTSLSQNVTSTGQTSSTWSGGFQIDRPYAFTVMLRLPTSSKLVKALSSDINNSDSFSSTLLNRLFLRIDANALPPPFRLENMSYVALSYQQVTSTLLTPENSSVTVTSTPNLRRARRIGHRTQSRSEQQRLSTGELDGDSLADTGVENVEMDKSWPGGAVQSYLSPQTSTPYALEEPQYAPTIMLHVQGGLSAFYNLEQVGLGKSLIYDNFVYLTVFGPLVDRFTESGTPPTDSFSCDFVFDVLPNTHRVVYSPKIPGRRAQLWWLSDAGLIFHEGSSSPSSPANVRAGSSDSRSSTSRGERGPFRVDADTARQFDVAQLIVAPVNKRRKHLQTWRIDQHGLLVNSALYCVQVYRQNLPTPATSGSTVNTDFVGTPILAARPRASATRLISPLITPAVILPLWLRPGSGRLQSSTPVGTGISSSRWGNAVFIDSIAPQLTAKPEHLATSNLALSQKTSEISSCDYSQFRVLVSLPLGIGVSVVSMFAEELVYASLFNLRLSFSRAYSLDVFDRLAAQEALEPDSPPAGGLNVAGDVLLGSGATRPDTTPIGKSNDTLSYEEADLMNNWVEIDSGFQPCIPRDSLSDFVRLDVGYVQVNSQFPGASLPILLYTDASTSDSSASNLRSANSSRRSDDRVFSPHAFDPSTLTVTFQREVQQRWMVHLFKTMQINVNPVVIQAEELLLLKLIQFWQHATCASPVLRDLSLGSSVTPDERVHPRPSDSSVAMDKGPLFWFDRFTISAVPLKLSVQTAKKSLTSSNLAGAKRLLPSLMSFTNAEVRLEPLVRAHVLETGSYFIDYLVTHYQLQLRAHAVHIFGSVDFLGNPIGLINDLTSGISGLVELDVGSLIRHVAHGVGDSTAKVSV
ncbi:hypothetical protein AHF37_03837 [Paragonimus kellicotti]|nr:hypothetical protein AHF37_03837 [Paragonimus kellicotti]